MINSQGPKRYRRKIRLNTRERTKRKDKGEGKGQDTRDLKIPKTSPREKEHKDSR